MEDLTIEEIVLGLKNEEYFPHRLTLLSLLSNLLLNEDDKKNQEEFEIKRQEWIKNEKIRREEEKLLEDEYKKKIESGEIKPTDGFNVVEKSKEELELDEENDKNKIKFQFNIQPCGIILEKKLAIELFTILFFILMKTNTKLNDENKLIMNLLLSCLVNLTINEKMSQYLAELIEQASDSTSSLNSIDKNLLRYFNLGFVLMIRKFLDYNPQIEPELSPEMIENSKELGENVWDLLDEYQYAGNLLCNLCRHEFVRKVLLKQSNEYFIKFPELIATKNESRRGGVIGIIKSCLFDETIHWWAIHEIKIVPALLYPIIAPIPFTKEEKENMDANLWIAAMNPNKEVDPNPNIIFSIIECMLLLCQKRGIREEIRKMKVYPIVRNLELHLEAGEELSENIYKLVTFLVGEEEKEGHVDTYEEEKEKMNEIL